MTNSSSSSVAVLGLGRMGAAMARRLAEQGWTVTGWTRSGRDVLGIDTVSDPTDAVREAAVVVLALFDGPSCEQVLDLCVAGLAPDTVVVNTTTAAPHEAAAFEKTVLATGATYVHAPVMGSVPAVRAGSLRVLVGTSAAHLGAAGGVVAALGEVIPAGGVADAAALKLVANSALGGAVLAVRDSRRYAVDLGVADCAALDVLERGALGAIVQAKRDQPPAPAHFTAAALAKDLALLAAESPVATTMAARVSGALAAGVAEDADIFALTEPATTPSRSGDAELGLSLADGVATADDVLEPLRSYVRGHATGDPEHFRRAFLPSAHVEGLRDGGFVSWRLAEYCALFAGTPAADEAERRRRIEQVLVSGTVGTATMSLRHGADTFIDVFVLVRVDDGWRIANKAYHRATTAD